MMIGEQRLGPDRAFALELEERIDKLLAAHPFVWEPEHHDAQLLSLLQAELAHAEYKEPRLRRYFEAWPVPYRSATRIADLPYLPVGVFKANPPLALVEPAEITRTLTSSATTGQIPSRIVLDAQTSKRMTRGVMSIVRSFIGPMRRPYLVIDTPENLAGAGELSARTAAIQGLRSFATEIVCCLRGDPMGALEVDEAKVLDFAAKWRSVPVLAYGFTYVLWQSFVLPLQAKGICLDMPNVCLLHSGGWKRLQALAVTRDTFATGAASVFGCDKSRVLDFYGMVENVGIVYPDCDHGNKHVPAFGEVIVRDPLTLAPVQPGEQGLVQVCSVLPTSFPGQLVLTEDVGEIISYDGCPCRRRGTSFQFVNRAPKAEVRGCGNVPALERRSFEPAPYA
jgi:hypothetical protein